jgi:hypothetical protein
MKRKEEDIQPWILDLTKASYDAANRKFYERLGKPPTEWWDLLAWGDNKLFHVEMIEAAVQEINAPPPPSPSPAVDFLGKLRAEGWSVAVHNDYRLNGESYTFWLLTKHDRFIKGEGRTDAEALKQAAESVYAFGNPQ